MFEKRLYTTDPEVDKLAENAEQLAKEASDLEYKLSNMALNAVDELNEKWINQINTAMGMASKADRHADKLERELNDLMIKRTKWKRIPPVRFWKKGS